MKTINIAITLFVLMFILSGGNKILDLGKTEGIRLGNKIGLRLDYAMWIVFLAGVFELITSLMTIYGSYTENKEIALAGLTGLMLFTIAATIIFYINPFKFKPFMSNLSIITGIYLIMNICAFQE